MARGQTAFEYLLIIGGSIMLASIMLVAVQGNLVAVSPGIDIRVSSIKKLTAAIETGISCSDCDAAFVNVGEYQSVSNYMLTPDSVDSGKIADGSILYTDVNTGQIQRRVGDDCPVGSAIRKVLEDGSVVCDTASWVVDGEDQYARTSGNVGIGTTSPQAKLHVNGDVYQTGGKVNIEGNTTMTVLNVTKALYAPGMGAGSVNITFLNATNATIDNLTVRNIYVTDNAAVGMALTATNLNARSGISAPGFV
jgi:hypothetical protein